MAVMSQPELAKPAASASPASGAPTASAWPTSRGWFATESTTVATDQVPLSRDAEIHGPQFLSTRSCTVFQMQARYFVLDKSLCLCLGLSGD